MPQRLFKIAIIVEALGGGGAERSAGLISKIFKSLGHDIFMITITDVVAYPYSGELINLGLLKNKRNDPINRLRRFLYLKKWLNDKKIYFVIDFRFKQHYAKEYFIAHFLYKKLHAIYAVRSAHLDYYIPKFNKRTQKLFANLASINCVSNDIEQLVKDRYGFQNTSFIPNPIDFKEIEQLKHAGRAPSGKFILAVGRMNVDVKQFDKLIRAYAQSDLPKKQIALKILGTGKFLQNYKNLAHKLKLEKLVHFEGFKENPFPYYKNALFSVICSKFEGSPRVVLESLACGTAVVAMDCPTGPRELIQHKKNGLLVPNADFEAFKHALNYFLENDELRKNCAGFATASIASHRMENVAANWQKLLNKVYETT